MRALPTLLASRPARIVILCVVIFVGVSWSALAGHPPARAAGSYLAGILLGLLAFGFGTFNIRLTDRFAPQLTLVVALFSYALTAIALALVLAGSSPRVVHAGGMAAGLLSAVVLWTGKGLLEAVIRVASPSEHLTSPVNILPRDER